VKVWIYKGDILPYKLSSEDKISREAAWLPARRRVSRDRADSSRLVVVVAGRAG